MRVLLVMGLLVGGCLMGVNQRGRGLLVMGLSF